MAETRHTLDKGRQQTRERVRRTDAYAEQVRRQYQQAVNRILSLKKSVPQLDEGVMYSFDGDTRKVQREVESILRELHSATLASIRAGISEEWEQANKEVDALITASVGRKALKDSRLSAWFDRGEKAMTAFADRADRGMSLSDRVWRDTRRLRDEMEVAMTVSIGEGKSAAQMSRQVRQYLNDPDRWQRLDFVLGQHIEPSGQHPANDICDELSGDYPKDFVFEGWHPQCMCVCTPILATEEQMRAEMDAVLSGDDGYQPDYSPVEEYPEGFQRFVDDNADDIERSYNSGTAPYFIQNNPDIIEDALNGELPVEGRERPDDTEDAETKKADEELSEETKETAEERDERVRRQAIEKFASLGKSFSEKDITVEDGYVRLSETEQHEALVNSVRYGEASLIYGDKGGHYIRTGESFAVNAFLRDKDNGFKNPVQRIADIPPEKLKNISKEQLDTIKTLDDVISRNTAPFPMRVTRVVESSALDNLMGVNIPQSYGYGDIVSALQGKKGAVIQDAAYMSCGTVEGVTSFKFRDVKLTVDIPAGTNLFMTANTKEVECILGRNTKLRVEDVKIIKDRYGYDAGVSIHVKVIKP